jgi:exopolyphosphatase/guanosine-5'-triphosphate,3'-diphosphate pyrophosphatase
VAIPPEQLYGALDLGTNNCRLLIATPGQPGFVVTDAFSRIVRLGEGLSRSGRLDQKAMDRTVEALRVCANKLIWRKVKRRRLVATEACRRAENGAEFIDRVTRETGLELEIIDRETEAQLAATGAAPLVDEAARHCLVFDIGGGSTEIMWLVKSASSWSIAAWTSLAAGVVTIAERFGGTTVSQDSFASMREHLRQPLASFARNVEAVVGEGIGPDHLLGTSGTVTTIAGVQLGLRRYDRSKVDGCWLESGDVSRVTEKLLGLTLAERAAHPCIGKERADLVLAGCAILEEIKATFPATRIRVADRGLREGILTLMMQEDGVYGKTL